MPYSLIMNAMLTEPWMLKKDKLIAVADFMSRKHVGVEGAKFTPSQDRKVAEQRGSVMVIPVHGVISHRMNMMTDISGGTSTEKLGKAIDAAIANADIKAVILDIDSPGGAVSGTPELADKIYASRGTKPIIAQVNAMAASAAYYLAAAADEIVVTPSGEVGSIGVYMLHQDVSAMMDEAGVKNTFIYAGEHKVDGNPYEPLGEAGKEEFQKHVDEAYDMFVAAVAKGRGVSVQTVLDKFGQGRVFGAKEAVRLGMADRVGTLSDTLTRFGVGPYTGGDKRKADFQRMECEAEFLGAGHTLPEGA